MPLLETSEREERKKREMAKHRLTRKQEPE